MNQLSLKTARHMLAIHCANTEAGTDYTITKRRHGMALTLALALCALAGLVFVGL